MTQAKISQMLWCTASPKDEKVSVFQYLMYFMLFHVLSIASKLLCCPVLKWVQTAVDGAAILALGIRFTRQRQHTVLGHTSCAGKHKEHSALYICEVLWHQAQSECGWNQSTNRWEVQSNEEEQIYLWQWGCSLLLQTFEKRGSF